MVLIIIISLVPGESFANVEILSWDKILHFIEYLILGVLAFKVFSKINYSVFFIIIIGTSFGCFNEVLQIMVPGRSSSLYDALANLFGVTIGAITSSINKKYII